MQLKPTLHEEAFLLEAAEVVREGTVQQRPCSLNDLREADIGARAMCRAYLEDEIVPRDHADDLGVVH